MVAKIDKALQDAVQKLREINVFYKDISDDAVDDSAKKTVEVVNSVSGSLLASLYHSKNG